MTSIQKKIIIFLSVTALILSVGLLYLKQKTRNQQEQKQQSNQQPSANADLEEPKLLAWPPPDASEEFKKKHDDLVKSSAVEGNTISVKNCKSDPTVLKTAEKSLLTFKSLDTDKDPIITVDENHVYDIKPGKSLKVAADFKNGKGIYGYTCKETNDPKVIGPLSGYIVVE